MIEITCYGKKEKHKESDRKELMDFYMEGMIACDGSEKDRYTSIYCGLLKGLDFIDDEWGWCSEGEL